MHVPVLLRAAFHKGFQVEFIRRFSTAKTGTPQATLIEKTMIKPMHPTLFFGKNHKLSFLDQISDGRYIPIAFFFPKQDSSSSNTKSYISQLLKDSLSKVLVSYYPFAGTLMDDTNIHCNDQGVEFQEVQFDCPLSEFFDCPHTDFESLLFPKGLPWAPCDKNRLFSIQLNHFDCGGVVLSLCMTHTLGDAWSAFNFTKDWASLSRGASVKLCPQFDGASIFPPIDDYSAIKDIKAPGGQCISKRYVFSASKIQSLKDKIASTTDEYSKLRNYPTSVEAISTVLLKSAASNSNKPSLLFLTTDLRRRAKDIIPPKCIGNTGVPLYIFAREKREMELQRLVGEFKKEKERVSSAYNNVTRETLFPTTMETIGKAVSMLAEIDKLDLYVSSSLSKLPAEDIDFGWGGPKRVIVHGGNYIQNVSILCDNLRGDGIEVFVQLEEQKMHALESAQEMLEFASPYGGT
uniref:Acylsugar acyltransferase n=1 Tax=Petunia axillaris TaxID=33119 RepID=A0A288PMY3_PETAX|nr:acylsugar acyltransferase [Petunia axillaris]